MVQTARFHCLGAGSIPVGKRGTGIRLAAWHGLKNPPKTRTLLPLPMFVLLSHFYVHLKRPVVQSLSHISVFETPWTVAHQAPLSMEFSRQEYWSGLPFPSPGDLSDPQIQPLSLALAGRLFTTVLPSTAAAAKSLQSCPTLCDPMDDSLWNSPGQNTGVGSLSLLQGIFPTQGLNPAL